jgi:hypothetical protein
MSIDPRRVQALERLKDRRRFRSHAGTVVLTVIVLNLIWVAGDRGSYWPMWAMIGLFIMLLYSGYRAYGPRDDAITDEEIERESRRGAG